MLSFLSSFPNYLDILVQCTRKTEVRSWHTLFASLPPPQELFEESLRKGLLKTAGGYLLILHTFEERDSSSEQCIHLLQRAKEAGDWDLCKELARFLMALDESGTTLRQAMERINFKLSNSESSSSRGPSNGATSFDSPQPGDSSMQKSLAIQGNKSENRVIETSRSPSAQSTSSSQVECAEDYFSS